MFKIKPTKKYSSWSKILPKFVTSWCLITFVVIFLFFSDFAKLTEHHQVTNTPQTLRNPAWNYLMVLWLKSEEIKGSFFTSQALIIRAHHKPLTASGESGRTLEMIVWSLTFDLLLIVEYYMCLYFFIYSFFALSFEATICNKNEFSFSSWRLDALHSLSVIDFGSIEFSEIRLKNSLFS